MKYNEKIICYIDILDFRKHIENTIAKDQSDNEEEIEKIANALESMKCHSAQSQGPIPTTRHITQFSDSIVISFDCKDNNSVFNTLVDIQLLLIDLVFRGFLCRGGVSLGKIVHKDGMVFGPGMIDAYTLESKAANYPRIIIGQDILKSGNFFVSEDPLWDMEKTNPTGPIGQDSDGMYYINYFSPDLIYFNKPEYSFYDYMSKLKQIIETGLRSNKKDIFVKYNWLKQRFNKFLKTYYGPDAINSEFEISIPKIDNIQMIK
jgi:hypothetical protein